MVVKQKNRLKRHSGISAIRNQMIMSYKEYLEEGYNLESVFDPWASWHDGCKIEPDRTLMTKEYSYWLKDESIKYSKKNKKLINRRKLRIMRNPSIFINAFI